MHKGSSGIITISSYFYAGGLQIYFISFYFGWCVINHMSYVSFCYILEQTRILKYWQIIRLTAFSYDAHLVSDGQKLRTLELNSWQILRLLQAQIPDFTIPQPRYTDWGSVGKSRCTDRPSVGIDVCRQHLSVAVSGVGITFADWHRYTDWRSVALQRYTNWHLFPTDDLLQYFCRLTVSS